MFNFAGRKEAQLHQNVSRPGKDQKQLEVKSLTNTVEGSIRLIGGRSKFALRTNEP